MFNWTEKEAAMNNVDNAEWCWLIECYHYTSEVAYYCQEMEVFNLLLGLLVRNDFEASFWHLEKDPAFTSIEKSAWCLEELQIL